MKPGETYVRVSATATVSYFRILDQLPDGRFVGLYLGAESVRWKKMTVRSVFLTHFKPYKNCQSAENCQ